MKFRSIMAAADLRRQPDPAVASADVLAQLTGAQLHILHCTTPDDDVRLTADAVTPLLPAGALLRVQEGVPSDAISEHAGRVDADVVVLGPRIGQSPLAGLLGSTADRVIRASRVPCLLSNAPLTNAPCRIMVAMDRSVPARQAFAVCADLVQALTQHGATTPAVHLVTIDAFALPGRLRTGLVNLKKYADRMEEAAPDVTVSRTVFAAPVPAEGILSCARSFAPDLLIMGTHGSGMFGRLVMGSVARGVAQHAEVPLLLVPPKRRRPSVQVTT